MVEMGLEALQANGWSGLALRDVARRLGVSLPAEQRHLPTKDDLWRGCVDRLIAERMPAEPELAALAPADRLPAVLRAQIERPSLKPGLTSAMLSDRSEGADERRAYLYRAAGPALEAGRARLEGAMDAGLVRPVDTDIVLALLGIGLSSLASAGPALWELFGSDLTDVGERERLAAILADVLLHGLQGPAMSSGKASPRSSRSV